MIDNLDDNALFLQEMDDVKPLKVEKKVALKRGLDSELALNARRKAATHQLAENNNHLVSDFVELLEPHAYLEFKRPGLQHGVFKKLKQGRYSQEARLDLHKLTVEKACDEVFSFIKECIRYDLRSLLIIHGKANNSQSNEALIKSHVNKWLPDMDEVQAFCSAQQRHGGLGAVYVLLAKSERKKQENRDHISRGRTIGG
jgi:DNA-nicking Smr family endonuclease